MVLCFGNAARCAYLFACLCGALWLEVEHNTKALETRWYNIRDYIRDGLLRVFHVGTNLNIADFFTKPLTGDKFVDFRNYLMGGQTTKDYVLHSMLARIPMMRSPPNPSCKRYDSSPAA